MTQNAEQKIVLVKRKSRLDELLARFNSVTNTQFYVEHLGADFSDYLKEHEEYNRAVERAVKLLGEQGSIHVLERIYLPNYLFGKEDIVVVIGQDGLVANTLKYLDRQPLIGVNPSPTRWDGVLLPFQVEDLPLIIPEVVRQRRGYKEVTMASASLVDGQQLLAVNDLFIGRKTHVSARYQLSYGPRSEWQSSSGIIVSTGLGSTGWFRSVLTGARGVVDSLTGEHVEIEEAAPFSWDADYLYFSVREPFPSQATGTELIFGRLTPDTPLKILSQMAENGVIFSDGIESDFLEFNSGMEATISLSEKKGLVII